MGLLRGTAYRLRPAGDDRMTIRPLRIAILAHSTNPRGGVVHALELGEALVRLGHAATVHAPDPKGEGFFRPADCGTLCIPAVPVNGGVEAMVRQRVAEYVSYFENAAHRRFDIFHAQDSISGNALATLKENGIVRRFARTVHHLDRFADPALGALQARAILGADAHFTVSRYWQAQLAETSGITAHLVGNGVDSLRYSAAPSDRDALLRSRLGLEDGPVFLSVGGVEERKNTIQILRAFRAIQPAHPSARLVIAGGASLLDHGDYRRAFQREFAASGLAPDRVIITGKLPQQDMPSLYRIADALVFASVKEGFGLVVLEAMASGLPAILSRMPPFTEYAGEDDAIWCDPLDDKSIASAMALALDPVSAGRLRGARQSHRFPPWLGARSPRASSRLCEPEGACLCLRYASKSSGPTASGSAAIHLPWSSRNICSPGQATNWPISWNAAARRLKSQASACARNSVSPAPWRGRSSHP